MEHLKEFCTDRQLEIVEAVIKNKTKQGAAEALGLSRSTVRNAIKGVEKKAAANGVAPHRDVNHRTMEGFNAKFVTSRYDGEGNLQGQYVRQEREKSLDVEVILEAIEAFEFKEAPLFPQPAISDNDLCTLITLTDFHLGMYSWAAESGDDWDIKIAERVAYDAVTQMVNDSPASEIGILNLQGDFLHFDSLKPVTPASGHLLDADSRSSKMIDLALQITMSCIEMMLKKFNVVRLIVCEGNHDEFSSAWLRKCAIQIYRNNPRLEVDDTEFPYYAFLHGKIMLGFHHGHKKKNQQLPSLFSSEPRYRAMWGAANYCYIHTGHYHHQEAHISEGSGAIVERHPTLASRDAYAARGGFISKRAAHAITYHAEFGEIKRTTVMPVSIK